MKDLQSIIDKRAEDKFKKDFSSDDKMIKEHLLYSEFLQCCELEKDEFKTRATLGGMLADTEVKMRIRKILEERVLPSYKEIEADLFVKEVEALKERVAGLNEEIDNLNF